MIISAKWFIWESKTSIFKIQKQQKWFLLSRIKGFFFEWLTENSMIILMVLYYRQKKQFNLSCIGGGKKKMFQKFDNI